MPDAVLERKKGHGHVFDDPAVKAEMIDLRIQGYSYSEIARKYQVDHTTIIYHCRVAGVLKFSDPAVRQQMYDMIDGGMGIDKVAEFYGCPSSIVHVWCIKRGMKGIGFPRVKIHLLDPLPRQPRSPRKLTIEEEFHRLEHSRPGWRRDERGEWICLGKSIRQIKREARAKKKRDVKKRQIDMLTY